MLTESDWVRLAVLGGLDPWGDIVLRDIMVAIDARRSAQDAANFQLINLLGNAMSTNPQKLEVFALGGKN
jgi:hypothetical protein